MHHFHFFFRPCLVWPACEADRWGAGCTNLCPSCVNGGVCDDVTGKCICPPGFHGDLCEIGTSAFLILSLFACNYLSMMLVPHTLPLWLPHGHIIHEANGDYTRLVPDGVRGHLWPSHHVLYMPYREETGERNWKFIWVERTSYTLWHRFYNLNNI